MVYSPYPALLTAAIEIGAAAWTFTSKGRKNIITPIGLILILLAGYQIAEVFACANPENVLAARIAFLDILWLPALGILLVKNVSDLSKTFFRNVSTGYFTAAACLALFIVFDPNFVNVSVCEIVFAHYDKASPFYKLFALYYDTGLAVIIFGAVAAMAGVEDNTRRQHLADIQIGTLSFVLPAMAVQMMIPRLDDAFASIMCHFALFFAFFLILLIRREKKLDNI